VNPTMVAIDKTLRDLEFDRVKAIVRQHASCSLGEEAVDALVPIADRDAIESAMGEVREAMEFLNVHGRFSLGAVRDLAPLLSRARESAYLDGEDFAVVFNTIEGTLQVQATLTENAEGPLLSEIAERLTAGGKAIRQNITRAIDERGGIREDATPELSQLTRRRRTIEGRIESKLQSFIDRNPELISEPVITRRRGRQVVAIRSGSIGAMEFIVHDRSATGQTLYAEPPGLVPENNLVSQLDSDIREETRRILRALTNEFLESETAFLRALRFPGTWRGNHASQCPASFDRFRCCCPRLALLGRWNADDGADRTQYRGQDGDSQDDRSADSDDAGRHSNSRVAGFRAADSSESPNGYRGRAIYLAEPVDVLSSHDQHRVLDRRSGC